MRKRQLKSRVFVASMMVSLVFVISAKPAQAFLGSISGVVSYNGQGVGGLKVLAYDYDTEAFVDTTLTQASGFYLLSNLPTGQYRVWVEGTAGVEYARQYYAGKDDYISATPVWALSDQTTTGIDFNIQLGGSISGKVTADFDDSPIQGLVISAYNYAVKKWLASGQTQEDGGYIITSLPVGNYRVKAEAWGGSPYAVEYFDDTYNEILAEPVNVKPNETRTDIDFSLTLGGTITGTIYESGSSLPLTGASVGLEAVTGNTCEDFGFITNTWSSTMDGTFKLTGLPPIEVYLRIDEDSEGQNYAHTWWAAPTGTYSCMEAEAINVVSGVTFPNRNFELEAGGILSGVVVSPNRSPLKDVQVTYYNSVSTQWERQFTPKDGTFTFSNLAPGPAELSIEPPLHSGLVTYQRKYWIGPGEGKNLGLVQLSPGALIHGVLKDTLGDPISGIEYTYDGDYELGRGATATNGSFEFRLPAGNYALNLSSEAGYTVTPLRIVVSGTDKTITLPDITAYDRSNAAMTSGNIQGHADRHGDFLIIAFASEQDFTSDRWNGVGPMAFGLPDQGEFEVFVPPGTNINLALLLYSENDYGQESITVVDTVSGISPPAAGVTLKHSKEGQTIQGAVKDRGEAVFNAEVVLIRTPEDTFGGSAMTDKDGKYALYNVQKGKYRVFVLYYDHPVVSGGNLTVRNSNVTIPDIDLSRGGAINSCLFLLLGGS